MGKVYGIYCTILNNNFEIDLERVITPDGFPCPKKFVDSDMGVFCEATRELVECPVYNILENLVQRELMPLLKKI